MSQDPIVYHKLPGRATGLVGVTRLWFAPDHLLSVTSTGIGIETYRRFFFRQIKALVILESARRLIWNCIFGGITGIAGCLAAIFLASAGAASGSDRGALAGFGWFFAIVAGIFAVCMLVNSLLGPIVLLYVHTPAGMDRLGAPLRRRTMIRLQAMLTPLIRSSQSSEVPKTA
jgi:hypothetical protein